MWIAAGHVKDLVDWFNSSAEEKILCMFAPRNLDDEALLGELFDARGTLNARLGPDVAFCLFSSQATLETVKAREPSSSDYLLVPGLVDTRNLKLDTRTLSAEMRRSRPPVNWQAIAPELAHVVPDSVRGEVQRRSAAIADEFVECFEDLESDDLPCLIFVFKGDSRPFVVPTHGGAGVSAVIDFFDALAEVSRQVETSGALALPRWAAEKNHATADVELLRTSLRKQTDEARRALAAAAEAGAAYELRQTILDIGPDRAHQLYQYLGVQKQGGSQLFVSESTRSAARLAMLDENVAKSFRNAVKSGKNRCQAEDHLHQRESELRAIEREFVLDSVAGELETVERSVERLCEKYERRFKRARNFMSVKKFVRLITGTLKAVENLTTSIGKTADEVAKSLDN
jgi:hypothetical protein